MKKELEGFLRYLQSEAGYSPNTVAAYRIDIGMGLIPFLYRWGKTSVSEVSRQDISAYADFLAGEMRNSNATRARKLATVKSFFNYLEDKGVLVANPAARIKMPKVSANQPVYLSENECIRLVRVAQEAKSPTASRDSAMLLLLLHTGLRASETANLIIRHLDVDGRMIRVTRKGSKVQYVNLNDEVARALSAYEAVRPKTSEIRLFLDEEGKAMNRSAVYRVVRRSLSLAGINKAKSGPHVLRHTFCTRLHQKGVSPFVIKALAGHESLQTTLKYVAIGDSEEREAVKRLEFGLL